MTSHVGTAEEAFRSLGEVVHSLEEAHRGLIHKEGPEGIPVAVVEPNHMALENNSEAQGIETDSQNKLETPETVRVLACLEALMGHTLGTVGAALAKVDRAMPTQYVAVEDILVGYNKVATSLHGCVQVKRVERSEGREVQGVDSWYELIKGRSSE